MTKLAHLSDGSGPVLLRYLARPPARLPQVQNVLQHEADAQVQLQTQTQAADTSKVLLHQVLGTDKKRVSS